MIVLDAADIDAVSTFWAGFLDGTVEKWGDRWHSIWVDGEWALGVQSAPNHVQPDWPDGAPQQIHFDFAFDNGPAGNSSCGWMIDLDTVLGVARSESANRNRTLRYRIDFAIRSLQGCLHEDATLQTTSITNRGHGDVHMTSGPREW